MNKRPKAERQAWWRSLSPQQQAAYIERVKARKARNPDVAAIEASIRLDIAGERGCFMSEVPDEDVQARMAANVNEKSGRAVPLPG